ncbi:MAG: hypothetical protein ACLFU6_12790 [Candidatus Hydrogenedentota bacterium]
MKHTLLDRPIETTLAIQRRLNGLLSPAMRQAKVDRRQATLRPLFESISKAQAREKQWIEWAAAELCGGPVSRPEVALYENLLHEWNKDFRYLEENWTERQLILHVNALIERKRLQREGGADAPGSDSASETWLTPAQARDVYKSMLAPFLDDMPSDDAIRGRLRYHGDESLKLICERDAKGARWYEFESLNRFIEIEKTIALNEADEAILP